MGSSWFWPAWFSVLNIFTWSAFHNEIYSFSKRSTWSYRGKYIKDKIIFKHEINQHLTSFCFFQTTNFQKLRLPVLVLFKTGEKMQNSEMSARLESSFPPSSPQMRLQKFFCFLLPPWLCHQAILFTLFSKTKSEPGWDLCWWWVAAFLSIFLSLNKTIS